MKKEAETVLITEEGRNFKLWHAVVDKVTVYNDGRLVYSLKDGSEITVML